MKSCRLRRTTFPIPQELDAGQTLSTRTAPAIFYNACWQLAVLLNLIKRTEIIIKYFIAMGLQHVDMSPYKAIVQAQTFGHLAPKPLLEYNGFILFTLTCFGDTCIIEFVFDGLEASPWFNSDIVEYIGDYTDSLPEKKDYGVFRFDGTYKKFKNGNYKFQGMVCEIPCGGKNI